MKEKLKQEKSVTFKQFKVLHTVEIGKRLKQQKGVTLVALGTTIVILMIIARNNNFYANIRPWNN